ncbi:hypothetical protein [Moorella sp. E306M]|jgi:hypothetical protein|uniref:hypothetical protein n=1 Tax=Moorella sp. E306M TaxID=2572683 RepID=UPI0010FFBC7F|nr:hypothetical protein [Moorella sp. E306M]GEA18696.1 hypothetical protein E306M_18330 [Moorella sp. E306M]
MKKHRSLLFIIFTSTVIVIAVFLSGCGQSKKEVKEVPRVSQEQVNTGGTNAPENSRTGQAGEEKTAATASQPKTNPDQNNQDKSQKPPGNRSPLPGRPSDTRFYERQDFQGGIEVEVIWLTPEYLQALGQKLTPEEEKDLATNFVFNIALTAHSGNLMEFNFSGNTSLKVNGRDAGQGTWEFVYQDFHHPEGMIRFKVPANEPVRELTLSINNLGGVPVREFKWEL